MVTTSIFEIKRTPRAKWVKVRASGMKALSDWAKENNIHDWRTVGMQSRSEMLENQSLPIVA